MGLGPVGQVAEGPFTDLAVLTIALAQQDRGGRVPVGDGFDIHGGVWAHRSAYTSNIYYITWLHFRRISGTVASNFSGLVAKGRRKLRLALTRFRVQRTSDACDQAVPLARCNDERWVAWTTINTTSLPRQRGGQPRRYTRLEASLSGW